MFSRLRTAPLAQLDSPQDWIYQLLKEWPDQSSRVSSPDFPPLNVRENEGSLRVEAYAPGYELDDIDVSVAGNELIISASPKTIEDDSVSYHRRERKICSFRRSLELPFPVETDDVTARILNGVLTVELPKAREALPRTIKIECVRS